MRSSSEEHSMTDKTAGHSGRAAKDYRNTWEVRHIQCGPLFQVLLLKEAFAMMEAICLLNAHTWASGPPVVDSFAGMSMLNALPESMAPIPLQVIVT